jgi:carbamate kinase
MELNPIAVLAIGGNSLMRPGQRGGFADQQGNARVTCEGIADVLAAGYRMVLTHGNGPQVGNALLRTELSQPELPPVRLDECDAETQGEIGYLLQQTLDNVLAERSWKASVVSMVTQVVVDASDPAFRKPTKPIGPFYAFEEALDRKRKLHWEMIEDSGRGWRRVVASPRPLEIVELDAVRACIGAGAVVIAAGGGGIPVVRRAGKLEGVEAVIDKDRVSALLARCLRAKLIVFSTGVDRVAVHFGRPDQRPLAQMSWHEAQSHLREGEFPAGSMGPKIEAALEFLEEACTWNGGDCRAIVTSPENLAAALRGEAGTQILPPVSAPSEQPAVA